MMERDGRKKVIMVAVVRKGRDMECNKERKRKLVK